jgi:hypothetical protein
MKAMLIGLVCVVVVPLAALTALPAHAENNATTQTILMSILQQLVLIEQHTRPSYQLKRDTDEPHSVE